MKIGKKIISEKNEPFIIAEMSGNHNNSIETALKIVEAAASAGADAIKLQTFTSENKKKDNKNKFDKLSKNFEKKINQIDNKNIRNSLFQLIKAIKK